MPINSLEICAHVIALHTEQQSCHTIAKKLGTTPSTINHIKVDTPIHDNIRELVTWECKEHGVKLRMC